jgi:hypothetical protein
VTKETKKAHHKHIGCKQFNDLRTKEWCKVCYKKALDDSDYCGGHDPVRIEQRRKRNKERNRKDDIMTHRLIDFHYNPLNKDIIHFKWSF